MGLEDLAMMRAVHGSTVLYPCCANQTAKLVAAMADRQGVVYLRTTRAKTPILYGAAEDFPIGGSKVLRESDADRATVVAAGITVHEALKAYDDSNAHRRSREPRPHGLTDRHVCGYAIQREPYSHRIERDVVESGKRTARREESWQRRSARAAPHECRTKVAYLHFNVTTSNKTLGTTNFPAL
jgi:hypothetical protein